MKILVTAPVYITKQEHKQYLDMCTSSISSNDHDIIFVPVENHVESLFHPLSYTFNYEPAAVHIAYPRHEQSVAHAWNIGIEIGLDLGVNYILVINTDIVFKSNAIDRLVTFAESKPDAIMWTAAEYSDLGGLEDAPEDENYSEHPHFSCFMVKPNFFEHVGRFDENFVPAYCEDGDMHARIALANKKAYIYGGSRFYHWGSRTIKSDRKLWDRNSQTFPRNQQYFLTKWGHPPVNDVNQMREVYFKNPYNEPGKNISFWRE